MLMFQKAPKLLKPNKKPKTKTFSMTWLPDTAMAHPQLARLPPALLLPGASPEKVPSPPGTAVLTLPGPWDR